MKIDKEKLLEIASEAIESEKAKEEERKTREKIDKQRTDKQVQERADAIVASIPAELEKAALHPRPTKDGIVVVARVPIVGEGLNSFMSTKGYLNTEDEAVLEEVSSRLKVTKFDGVDEISVRYSLERLVFQAADGDTGDSVPCRQYFVQALVKFPYPEKAHS